MTTLLLERLGYQVQNASSGEEALRLARGSRKQIDLLLTDMLMPGMSGSELAEVLLAGDPTLKVLFLSGHTVVRHSAVHTECWKPRSDRLGVSLEIEQSQVGFLIVYFD